MSNEQEDSKDADFRSVVRSAWVETKMERDRTIVTISVGAIGLLVTLLTTVGIKTPWTAWLYMGALAGFALAATCSIIIFDRNSAYLEKVLQGSTSKSKLLGSLDRIMLLFFGLGVILTILIGVTAAGSSLRQGVPMKELVNNKQDASTLSQETFGKSLNGIVNLKDQAISTTLPEKEVRSLNGIPILNLPVVPTQGTDTVSTPEQSQAQDIGKKG